MKKLFTHWTIAFVTLIVLTWIGLKDPQVKEILRLKSFDLLLQSEKKEISTDIHVLTIDEKAIEKYGQWPWNREVLASVVNDLREMGAGTIVMPILFSEYDRLGGDNEFINTIHQNGVVIAQVGTNQTNKNAVPRGVAKIGDPLPWLFEWGGMVGPVAEFGQYADGVGVTNTAPEVDGVVRRIPLLMRIGEDVYPSIAIETIRVATGDPSYQVKAGDGGIIAMRVPGFKTIKTDANGRIWLRWNSSFMTTSLADLYDTEVSLRGKTIIIGMSAEGLGGVIATPTGERYAYDLTASTLQTVLDGKHIQRVDISFLIELAVAFLLGSVIIILTRFTPYWVVGLKMVVFYGATIYTVHYLFEKYLILADGSWAIITITVVGMHSIFNRFVLEFQLKQQIKKQFEHYLEPKMVKKLQQNPNLLKLGGERKELTFLFCDIRGFTPLSEKFKSDPGGLTKVINKFLTPMTDIIMSNGGTIDKYMGDCIMAFWNAPIDVKNHQNVAVKSAMQMQHKLHELNSSKVFGENITINIGIGINSGYAYVGNMGSNQRFDYSVIGDPVNLASRLEGVSKNYDATLIVGEDTYSSIKNQFNFTKIDDVQVKGKSNTVSIYTVKEPYDYTTTNEEVKKVSNKTDKTRATSKSISSKFDMGKNTKTKRQAKKKNT
jgi:adenylate cyclase